MRTSLPEVKLRRTMLFIPAISEKMIKKGALLEADSLIIDMEDAVAWNKKSEAREVVCRCLDDIDFAEKEICIRINPVQSEIGILDLKAIVKTTKVDTIVLPKVESDGDVNLFEEILNRELSGEQRDKLIKLIPMIETARGVLNCANIASSSERVVALLFGAADMSTELRCETSIERNELLVAMQNIILGARSARVDAIDSPYLDINDREGLVSQAKRACEMGFDGKSVIHPSQIEVVNDAFTPDKNQIEQSIRIVKQWKKAQKEGRGVALLEGKLIENPHLHRAMRVISLAKKIGLLDSSQLGQLADED
jgi:citrate lyase subunit beta/citryl-CoA lyase